MHGVRNAISEEMNQIVLTCWKMQSCGNVRETSSLISSTLDSRLPDNSVITDTHTDKILRQQQQQLLVVVLLLQLLLLTGFVIARQTQLTVVHKKCGTSLLTVYLPIIDQFSKCFHCHSLQTICNNMIIIFPTMP